ncbi:NUDIX hydrolase [Rhodococcus rhodnii]|uniref:NUDIX hydrolase n=1 Tax=Rhodococcus rhodnii TaxID=38312 RepID=A0A6P2CJ91_9NOCA|nr:NUDIX hydrolase [Rhodococcus rhodnii]
MGGDAPPRKQGADAPRKQGGDAPRARTGRRGRGGKKGGPALRTVRETSAGGLVVSGLDGPRSGQRAALIGRTDRRGRLLWSMPKGHIEAGETSAQTAVREVKEETGIDGVVLAPLGTIDYWFVAESKRVHKTVHHFLLRATGGELSDEDVEVTEVAWVPLDELDSRLAYADERKLARIAEDLITSLQADLGVPAARTANTRTPDSTPLEHEPRRG